MYDGYFGGKGRLDGAANAASDLSYDGGHFEFISKTGGEGGSKVDFSAKNDLAAKADAAASGSQVADVIVSGDEGQGSMTKDDLRFLERFRLEQMPTHRLQDSSAATECQDTTWDI